MLVVNLEPQAGETSGFAPEAHLDVLRQHAPWFTVDVVLADASSVVDLPTLERAAAQLGASVELAPVRDADGSARHDPQRLAQAFEQVVSAPRDPSAPTE